MWWLRYKSVLEYLDKSKDSSDKKSKIISKKSSKIKEEISKLQEQQLIYYLFDSQISEIIKKIILSEIDSIYENSFKKDKITNIMTALRTRNISKKELDDLYNKYGKNSITLMISELLYPENIQELVLDKKNNLKTKKMLILLKFNSKDIPPLLAKLELELLLQKNVNENKELINFIIKEPIYTNFDIYDVIKNKDIGKETKEQLLKYQVNITNIEKVLGSFYLTDEVIETIYEVKSSVINEYINNLNEKKIIEYYSGYYKESQLSKLIFERKKEVIINLIKNTKAEELWSLFSRLRYEKVSKLIYELREKDFNDYLLNTPSRELLDILNHQYVKDLSKNIILSKRKDDIEKEIKNLKDYEITQYLRSDTIPSKIKDLILKLDKDLVIKTIEEIRSESLRSYIIIYDYYSPYTDLIIELRVNENNIYSLIKSGSYYPEKVKRIIELKNDIIRNKLKTLKFHNLTTPNREILPEIADYIIKLNKDIIDELISKEELDAEEVGTILVKDDVNDEIKKSLIRYLGMGEENLSAIVELIKASNSVLVIHRYNDIKDFITSLGVNFKSFMQYGSGSTKYKNWLKQVLNIIDSGKSKEFMEVSSYFFKNYYYEDASKENNVYIISNLLEILYNYEYYYDLCISLTKNNISLSKDDKQDLKFLFSVSHQENIKTIDELKGLRKTTFDYYRSLLNDDKINNLSIIEIKNIFNNVIFSNGLEIITKIDGVTGLEALKNYNKNSGFLCAYIDELIKYARIIEIVNYSNDKKSLINALKSIFEGTFEDFISMQNEFSNFGKKITKLYELDSQINLTNIDKSRNIDGIINQELSEAYGGEVLDFSDKNYCLYAHILSSNENIDDLMNGRSTGKSNFISVSAISYSGQKYYYDYSKMILLFDEIKKGSFICSSKENIGSNRVIKNNSSEVANVNISQKGILETSSATKQNAEALLYREGLIPKAIALPGGRKPTEEELICHRKYNLPFVITQEPKTAIENVKNVFKPNEQYNEVVRRNKKIEKLLEVLSPKININKESDIYTGREIGLFTDSHGLYEPTLAVLEDMRKNGITEIYSLGDNVGLGPSPAEVIDMLEYYKVVSVMGNSEYYNTLGTKPFVYFNREKQENQEWTKDKLGSKRIERMKLWTPSIDLKIGDKKIALCHFANDIRWDYGNHSTWTYQENFEVGKNSNQFLYTNSPKALKKIKDIITSNNRDKEYIKGVLDADKHPIFDGKSVTDYDAIIQGHVHFDMEDILDNTYIKTLRGTGLGFKTDPKDKACYYVLKEKKDGSYDIIKKLVPYSRNIVQSNIKSSTLPHKELILRMTN